MVKRLAGVIVSPCHARYNDRARMLLLAAGAGAGSLVIASLVLTREIGWQWPGPSDLVLPAIGCAVGVTACLGWRGGWNTWRVVVLLTAPVVAGLALFAVSKRGPLVRESPAVTSNEKRRLYALLRHKDPKRVEPGEIRTLTLASRDYDLLLAWGLPVVFGHGRAMRASTSNRHMRPPRRCHSACPAVSAI